MNPNHYLLTLGSLCAYHPLQDQPMLLAFTDFFTSLNALQTQSKEPRLAQQALHQYSNIFHLLRSQGYRGLGDYLWDYMRFQPTHYGQLIAQKTSDPALEYAARREVDLLLGLAKLDCDLLLEALRPHLALEDQFILGELPRWSASTPFDFDGLTAFHQEKGWGIFAKYQHFLWQNQALTPVSHSTCRPYHQMLGFALQREQVLENTRKLVAGQPAQNILLFGDGGTGKSAVIKSMTQVPEFARLRLIQADNASLRSLPQLMAQLSQLPYPSIIFLDDLSFDQDDNTYSALKSILEGGLASPPANVLVYATSNRRHLVRQTFSERAGDEVDMMETISEKTALAERFGLRIPYLSMNKAEYLALVDYLYQEQQSNQNQEGSPQGKPLPPEILHHQAMMWEIRHGGRTPRVAGQFIHSLLDP